MFGIARDYLIGVISSVSAAILLGIVGFAGARRKSKGSPAASIRWIALTNNKGSIRDGLRAGNVFLAFVLALAMSIGTAFLSSGVGPIESKPPDAFSFEADSAIRMATSEADNNVQRTESEVQDTLREAEQRADDLARKHDPEASNKIKRIREEAADHANQMRLWNQQRNTELIESAKRRAETLRAQAAQRDLPTKLKIGTRIAVFSESTLWGLLLIFFTGHLIRVFGLSRPQTAGFLAAGALVLGIAFCESISGSLGTASLFEPFLIAAALFVSLDRDLSFGEVLMNSGYVVFQRFYSAVALAITGALAALLAAGGVFGLIYLGFKMLASDDPSQPLNVFPVTVMVGRSLVYVFDVGTFFTLLDFFELFASALCLSAFFSLLVGREPLNQPAYDFSQVNVPDHASPVLSGLRLSPIRRLLLLYRPEGARAWVAHSLFYFTLGSLVVGARSLGKEDWDEDAALITLLCFQLVIAYCFRYWALTELAWRLNNAPRVRNERSWAPQPSSGRELTARIFAILGGAKALQCVCLVVIAFFVSVSDEDTSAFEDLWPRVVIGAISMAVVCIFCRRWTHTEMVLSQFDAARLPRHHLLSLKPIGMPARLAVLTFYLFLASAILHAVRPLSMLTFDLQVDTLTWSSAGDVLDVVALYILMPLYASHAWAAAESARAIAVAMPIQSVADREHVPTAKSSAAGLFE